MFHEDGVNGASNNIVKEEINHPYLLDGITLCANEEARLGNILSSPMSSGDQKKKDDTNYTSKQNITSISHNAYKYNTNTCMVDKSKCKMAPKLIISAVTSNTQDDNITNSGANIFTSGLHGRQSSEYYTVLNEVLNTIYSVNPNAVSIFSADFIFLTNTNGSKKDIYTIIVSNMLDLSAKGIFYSNQVHIVGHFYDDMPQKLGGKKSGYHRR